MIKNNPFAIHSHNILNSNNQTYEVVNHEFGALDLYPPKMVNCWSGGFWVIHRLKVVAVDIIELEHVRVNVDKLMYDVVNPAVCALNLIHIGWVWTVKSTHVKYFTPIVQNERHEVDSLCTFYVEVQPVTTHLGDFFLDFVPYVGFRASLLENFVELNVEKSIFRELWVCCVHGDIIQLRENPRSGGSCARCGR